MLLYGQAIRKNPLHAMKLGDIEYRQHGKVVLLIFHLGSFLPCGFEVNDTQRENAPTNNLL